MFFIRLFWNPLHTNWLHWKKGAFGTRIILDAKCKFSKLLSPSRTKLIKKSKRKTVEERRPSIHPSLHVSCYAIHNNTNINILLANLRCASHFFGSFSLSWNWYYCYFVTHLFTACFNFSSHVSAFKIQQCQKTFNATNDGRWSNSQENEASTR